MKKPTCPSRNHCELCGEEASLYCAADSAFLCFRCDRRVHAANFLVARHVRRLTCPSCPSLAGSGSSAALLLSGSDPAIPLIRPLCSSCAPDGPSSSSSSSSCLSSDDESTSAPPAPPRKPWAEGCTKRTIAHWSRRIGMEGIAGVAAHVLSACGGGGMEVVPPRASMAAAILYAAKVCLCRRGGGGGGDRLCGEVVRRLERCSGVPAVLILAAESRIARAVRTRARAAAEGWADSEVQCGT